MPLIVRWPRQFRSGETSSQVMVSMDWLPTLLAAAGARASPRHASDGENLLAVLSGSEPMRARTIYWRYKNKDQAAVRHGEWKYLRRGENERLHNLSTDPRERANLKQKAPDVLTRLRDAHRKWNAQMLAYPPNSISAGES